MKTHESQSRSPYLDAVVYSELGPVDSGLEIAFKVSYVMQLHLLRWSRYDQYASVHHLRRRLAANRLYGSRPNARESSPRFTSPQAAMQVGSGVGYHRLLRLPHIRRLAISQSCAVYSLYLYLS